MGAAGFWVGLQFNRRLDVELSVRQPAVAGVESGLPLLSGD